MAHPNISKVLGQLLDGNDRRLHVADWAWGGLSAIPAQPVTLCPTQGARHSSQTKAVSLETPKGCSSAVFRVGSLLAGSGSLPCGLALLILTSSISSSP